MCFATPASVPQIQSHLLVLKGSSADLDSTAFYGFNRTYWY